MKTIIQNIIISLIFGAIGGLVIIYFYPLNNTQVTKTDQELIAEFYDMENAVYVSPHSIRKEMANGSSGSFILVDLRSQEEYEKEHIVGAINIPAYKDPNTSAYGDVDRIVGDFSKLSKDKDIIVYCYSMPCMTGRKVGKMLAEHNIYVKHLGIGWNEWRYYWNLWNHELEWDKTDVQDYIATGQEPGTPKVINDSSPCSLSDNLGC